MNRRIEAPHCDSSMSEGIFRLIANLTDFTAEQRIELQDKITNLVEDVISTTKQTKQSDEKTIS